MTKITIVIPALNSERWIVEALESVRSQTYPRELMETIVVDNQSSDDTVLLARSFLVRHAMQGRVIVADRGEDGSAAMNLGWRAGTGDWIQLLRSEDLLAANKFEVQTRVIPQLPSNVSVVCSRWRCVDHSAWLPTGPQTWPQLAGSIAVTLACSRGGTLGPALVRKTSIEGLVGFCGNTQFGIEEEFILRMAGLRESNTLGDQRTLRLDKFAEAVSASPLYFVRRGPGTDTRPMRLDIARRHLESAIAAQKMIHDYGYARLTRESIDQVASLCLESLADLRRLDRVMFRQYAERLREIDPGLVPARLAPSKWTGFVGAEPLAGVRRWIAPRAARIAEVSRRMSPWRIVERLQALAHSPMRSFVRMNAIVTPLAAVAIVGISASALLNGNATTPRIKVELGGFGVRAQSLSSQEHVAERPLIVVASTIYVEPQSSWPMPLKVRPQQLVPPGSRLLVQGLSLAATFSDGYRVSPAVWAVPADALANLNVRIAAAAAGRSDLMLLLVGPDGAELANAATTMLVGEPAGAAAFAAAQDQRPDKSDRRSSPVFAAASATASMPETSSTTDDVRARPAAKSAEPSNAPEVDEAVGRQPGREKVAPATAPRAPTTATPGREENAIASNPDAATTAPPERAGAEPARTAGAQYELNKRAALRALPDGAEREANAAPITKSMSTSSATTGAPRPLAAAPPKSDRQQQQRIERMIARGESALVDGKVVPPPTVATPKRAENPNAVDPDTASIASEQAGDEPTRRSAEHGLDQQEARPALSDRASREVIAAPMYKSVSASPTSTNAPPPMAADEGPRKSVAETPALRREEQQRIERIIARGESALVEGNVSVARQFFLRAAEASLARGALLLAFTYDAQEFARLGILGVQPSPVMALKWYKRARELGDKEAEERLHRLGVVEHHVVPLVDRRY